MPKLPRDVSHDRLVRFFLKRGWARVEGGRHTLLHRGEFEVTVPRHAKIRIGTLAQIPREEWSDL